MRRPTEAGGTQSIGLGGRKSRGWVLVPALCEPDAVAGSTASWRDFPSPLARRNELTPHPRRRLQIHLQALVLVTMLAGLIAPAAQAFAAPALSSAGNLDQCQNGKFTAPGGNRQTCTGNNWVNGDL